MSKTSNHVKLQVLKTWMDANIVTKPKKVKQPDWLKELEEHEKANK